MERLSLAQQIAQLKDVAPIDFDPEDIQVTSIDPDLDLEDNNAARAHYSDVGPSSLRKAHESLSDPKYDGSKISRTLMLDGSDDGRSGSSNEDSESDSDVLGVHTHTRNYSRESGEERETDTRTPAGESTEHSSSPNQNDDLTASLRKTREEDRKKGRAISRQIALWDSLLDARIRLQKSVVAGNRLPPIPKDTVDHQVHVALSKMMEEARLLSNEIFDLQEYLLSANESLQLPARKRRRSTETGFPVADRARELREATCSLSELECAYHPHLVQTLSKWSSKIQAVAPSVLLPSNRNAFSRATQHIKSAPQLIDETLADHVKVLARTRIYRGKSNRLGTSQPDDKTREEGDAEVFDDTDFYHQLLRDIIDDRGNGANDDWMMVQKQKKAKKKVDTRASKGRKLRYEVHEKMQNFMVPVPMRGGWHDEQIDELFASLLGKGFEGAMQDVGETTDELMQEEVDAALQGGFRIFG